MRKLIFFLLLFFSCNNNTSKEFLSNKLRSITVYEYVHTKSGNVITKISLNKLCTIKNTDSIDFILSVLNSKQQEPAKFMADYELELNYMDTIMSISVKYKFLKINGKTYKVRKNLSRYFASIKKH